MRSEKQGFRGSRFGWAGGSAGGLRRRGAHLAGVDGAAERIGVERLEHVVAALLVVEVEVVQHQDVVCLRAQGGDAACTSGHSGSRPRQGQTRHWSEA